MLDTKPSPKFEHSVPFFWPLALVAEMGKEGIALYKRNLDFLGEVTKEELVLGMIRGGFLGEEDRNKLIALARDGAAVSRMTVARMPWCFWMMGGAAGRSPRRCCSTTTRSAVGASSSNKAVSKA